MCRPRLSILLWLAQAIGFLCRIAWLLFMNIMPIVCDASGNFAFLAPRHIRAARALLDWTQDDLARRADVVRRTIVSIETGSLKTHPYKIHALVDAFNRAGIHFVYSESGVVSIIDNQLQINLQSNSLFEKITEDKFTSSGNIKSIGGGKLRTRISRRHNRKS
jgi:DNA-binding XRE family transcriptional regulator